MEKVPRSANSALRKIIRDQKGPGVPHFSSISEPRKARGKRHPFASLLRLLFACMLTATRSLRQVSSFAARRGLSVSYFALYLLLSRLKAQPFRGVLHAQIKTLYRAKVLYPQGLPCHVVAVDGKSIYYGKKKLNPFCQKTTQESSGKRFYHLRVLRAVLISNPLKLVIDQQPIPAKQNEMSAFPDFIRQLKSTYARSIMANPILSLDSGYTSFKNAEFLDSSGFGFIMALKGNQPGLLAEAKKQFEGVTKPEFVSEWELCQGKRKRTKLFRCFELRGWPTDEGDWTFLRQVWLVRTESQKRVGRTKSGPRKKGQKRSYHPVKVAEERYFLSNVLVNYLTPKQIASVVRGHWGVENNANWTSDVIYHEDESPWCRKKEAVLVLSLMRAMSMNMLNWLRHRHIRVDRMKGWSWVEWLEWVKEAMAENLRLGEKSHQTLS